MINPKHQSQAPFRSRVVTKDQPTLHKQESTGLIRYLLAQTGVVAGLVYAIMHSDPYMLCGSFVVSVAASGWFINKQLRRERNAK